VKYPRRPKKKPLGQNAAEDAAIEGFDELQLYEKWKSEILPALTADIANGLTPTQIIEKHKSILVARQLMRALSPEDTAVSAGAAKELLDRSEGKAVERKSVEHRLAALPDEQLDAVLSTKLRDLEALTDGEDS
jgi:hypothetical protein